MPSPTRDSIGARKVLLEHAAGVSDLAGQRGRVYYTRAGRAGSPVTLAPGHIAGQQLNLAAVSSRID